MSKKILLTTVSLVLFLGLSTSMVDSLSAEVNSPPTVKIERPKSGSVFDFGKAITFEGIAVDLEDGGLSGRNLVWTSDIDGNIGTGDSLKRKLSNGLHIILLTATDSRGSKGRESVFISVKTQTSPKPAKKSESEKPVKASPVKTQVKPKPSVKPVKSSIEFTYVPKYGSSENLKGRALNVKPDDFAVAVFIMVNGGWWTKPYWDSPLTRINSDGSWVCDITTGGVDEFATKISAYLVPSDYEPPLASGNFRVPQELEKNAKAKVEAMRPPRGSRAIITPKPEEKSEATTKTLDKLKGICYSPFRDNENPDKGIFPLVSGMEADIEFIPKVAKAIRTYGSTNTPSKIPALCEKAGIDCYQGAWLSKYKTENRKEIESLIRIASQNFEHVKALIVGNEVLLRKDMTEDELIRYIREVKKSTTLPVTTAEIWQWWLKHPQLVDEVDFLTVHVHPYWEGVSVEKAAEYVIKAWKHMNTVFPGKRIIIGETGWPSDGKKVGKAICSPENHARFLKDFTRLAASEGIEYFYFDLFDEKWKDKFEGKVGAHWGIYNSDGSLKPHNKGLVSAEAAEGISRPPRKVFPLPVSAPLVVYSDAGLDSNSFQPSGWMGDHKCIDLDKAYKINPHSGKTCIRITYTSKRWTLLDKGWSGIYWQYPLNNWGEYPGYNLTGATKLSFWARGKKGEEKAEFKVGGIRDDKFPHHDSFGPVPISKPKGMVKLTREWKRYTINLEGKETSSLIGGFCWVTNRWQNPKGCTIYLDDIRFEP